MKVVVNLEMTMSALVQLYSEAYRRGVDEDYEANACRAVNGLFDARPLPPREAAEAAYNIFRLILEGNDDSEAGQ